MIETNDVSQDMSCRRRTNSASGMIFELYNAVSKPARQQHLGLYICYSRKRSGQAILYGMFIYAVDDLFASISSVYDLFFPFVQTERAKVPNGS